MKLRLLLATMAFGLAASVAGAQAPASHDHAPSPSTGNTEATPAPTSPGGTAGRHGMMAGMHGHGGMMGAMHGGATMGEIPGLPLRHVEGRIAFLKAELRITEAQQPLWTGFADAYRSAAKATSDLAARKTPTGVTERLAHAEHQLQTRLDAVKAVRAALDPLYAALTADQKKLAEELMAPRGMM